MRTYRPRAARMPPRRALPFPLLATWMTRAPSTTAISAEPSVEPLSATITSPLIPASRSAAQAFRTQMPKVSASFRQGITTDSSIGFLEGSIEPRCRPRAVEIEVVLAALISLTGTEVFVVPCQLSFTRYPSLLQENRLYTRESQVWEQFGFQNRPGACLQA